MKKSFKGIYKPTNPKKYVGNPNNIVYRSLLERKFMVYCDNNPGVIQWASEELAIRYYNPIDKKYHRYFPDFILKTDKGKKMLIEIKPSRQCARPNHLKRKLNRICVRVLNLLKIKPSGERQLFMLKTTVLYLK